MHGVHALHQSLGTQAQSNLVKFHTELVAGMNAVAVRRSFMQCASATPKALPGMVSCMKSMPPAKRVLPNASRTPTRLGASLQDTGSIFRMRGGIGCG